MIFSFSIYLFVLIYIISKILCVHKYDFVYTGISHIHEKHKTEQIIASITIIKKDEILKTDKAT